MATSWPKERMYPFLDLLIAIAAQMQSAQDIGGGPLPDGSYRFTITPEVTAFSDNIVVSYPSSPDEPLALDETPPHFRIEPLWAKFMCQDANRILSADSGDCGQGFRLIADSHSDRSRTAFR